MSNEELMRFEARRQEDEQFEASMRDYREAGYELFVTEWERNFWEAGFRRGIDAALAVFREHTLAELRQERERADEAVKYAEEFLEQRNKYIGFEKQARAALSRAEEAIENVREASEHAMHPDQIPDRCGVCRIERLLTEYDKQKEADR